MKSKKKKFIKKIAIEIIHWNTHVIRHGTWIEKPGIISYLDATKLQI